MSSKFANKKLNLTKDFLLKEYVKKGLSAYEIGQNLRCSSTIIYYYLKKYNIKRRAYTENKIPCISGKNHPNYKDGKWSKSFKEYCSICGKRLSRPNTKNKKCITCFNKTRIHPMLGKHHSIKTIEKMLKTQHETLKISPNKCELKLNKLLQELFPKKYNFVGNGKTFIAGKCPDFIDFKNKKIIEMFGDYWHNETEEEPRKMIFSKYGYKTLIIWEHELENVDKLKNKIIKFTGRN